MGVVLYELCALTPPFHGDNLVELSRVITTANAPALPLATQSPPLIRLLAVLLHKDPRKRPAAEAIVKFIDREIMPHIAGASALAVSAAGSAAAAPTVATVGVMAGVGPSPRPQTAHPVSRPAPPPPTHYHRPQVS